MMYYPSHFCDKWQGRQKISRLDQRIKRMKCKINFPNTIRKSIIKKITFYIFNQPIQNFFFLIIGCPGQFVFTSTNFGILEVTTGQPIQLLKYMTLFLHSTLCTIYFKKQKKVMQGVLLKKELIGVEVMPL